MSAKRQALTIEMLVVMKRALVDARDLPLENGDESDKARRWVRQQLAQRRAKNRALAERKARESAYGPSEHRPLADCKADAKELFR